MASGAWKMTHPVKREIFFSFFMFTVDMKPNDREYTKTVVKHMKTLGGYGYAGFDLPIAPPPAGTEDFEAEVQSGLSQSPG
jgi:hypothetical protein